MGPKIGVSNNLKLFLIDLDEIFSMKSSEFTQNMFLKKTATILKNIYI